MSRASNFTLTTPDGIDLFVYCWLPAEQPKAVIQIAHGLAEHAGRYARLAEALTSASYAVYANDHRGHGRTVKSADGSGLFCGARRLAKMCERYVAAQSACCRHTSRIADCPAGPFHGINPGGAVYGRPWRRAGGSCAFRRQWKALIPGQNRRRCYLGGARSAGTAGKKQLVSRSPLMPLTNNLRLQERRSTGCREIRPRWINMLPIHCADFPRPYNSGLTCWADGLRFPRGP